ncbi:MAG: DUF3784 domain-containing protein, partial [Coriobacteriales bacterium]|nr:DUF3784 domain-containing protein [Coriobacteriales bacterium]
MDIAPLLIFGLIVTAMLVMAVFLLNGKGAFLIAGYNTLSAKEKARYDTKALCRSVGWLFIALSACMALIPIGMSFGMPWLIYGDIVLGPVIIIGYLIYANTGNRFRRSETLSTPATGSGDGTGVLPLEPMGRVTRSFTPDDASAAGTSKKISIVTVIILIITSIGVCVLFFFGGKEPVVNVLDNGIQIESLYGLTVEYSDIANISLMEESMSVLGVDERTNGYAAGGTQKGHFRSDSLGKILLFVKSKS